MTTLREAAQQALRAAEQGATVSCICILRAALAEPPTNQCGETCERAKLCAVCARGLAESAQEPDLSRCPKCGGPADNGHDRCLPPNPYHCTKCMEQDDMK